MKSVNHLPFRVFFSPIAMASADKDTQLTRGNKTEGKHVLRYVSISPEASMFLHLTLHSSLPLSTQQAG